MIPLIILGSAKEAGSSLFFISIW